MDGMQSTFQNLESVILSALGGAAQVTENRALKDMVCRFLNQLGHDRLIGAIISVRRADPLRGIRGSMLAISVRSQAVLAKLKLIEPDLMSQLKSQGLGFQSIRVVAQKEVAAGARPQAAPRPPPPAQALVKLRAIYSQDH